MPTECIPLLNILLAEITRVRAMPDGDEKSDAQEALQERQRSFTSRVEAVVRAARAPPTIQGMGQAILESLARLQASLDGIQDVLRFQVGIRSLYRWPV